MKVQTFHTRAAGGFSPALDSTLDSERTLVLVFGAPEMDASPHPLAALNAAFPKGLVIGCSTAGEISGMHLSDNSLTVAVTKFAATNIRLATAEVRHMEDSSESARALSRQLAAPDLRAVLVLSDGLRVNGSELARGFRESLPSE